MKIATATAVFLTISLFFSGCAKDKPEVQTKLVYIKQKVPEQRTLKSVKLYEITDIKNYDKRYYKVNKNQLKRAQKTTNHLRKQNKFYVDQAYNFNAKFVKK